MADRNLILQLLITAKDNAGAVFSKLYKFLDDETSVVAGKVREAFSNLFSGGLDSATELEAAFDAVAAKGGYTADEMVKLKQEAAKVAAQFGVTGQEAAKGLEILAAAGLSAKDAVATLPQVLALARSEGVSLDVAAERLSDSLAVLGLDFAQAGRMADVLAKGANLSTVSAVQLGESLSTVGGIAKAAGLSLEETVAALDLLAKNGLKGERAGTGLAAVLTQLQNPASTAAKALNDMGISTRDLGGVLDALRAGGARSEAAILAFGETAGPALRALIGEGSAGLKTFTEQLQNADGAALAAANQMGGNLKAATEALSAAFESVKQTLVNPLLEPLAQQAKALADAFSAAVQGGAFSGLTDAIKAIASAATATAERLSKAFDFRAIGANIDGLIVGGMNALGQAMNNVGAIAGALAAGALIPLGLQIKAGIDATLAFIATMRTMAASLTAAQIASVGLTRVLGILMGPVGWVMVGVGALALLWKEADKTTAATDALAGSSEEYTKKLQEQTKAQNQLALLKLNDALDAQRQKVDEAKAAYDQAAVSERNWILITEDHGGILGKTSRIVTDANEIARIRAERLAEVDTAEQTLAKTEERRLLIVGDLKAKQDAANQASSAAEQALGDYRKAVDEANAAQQKARDILDRLTPGTQLYAEWHKKLADAVGRSQTAQQALTQAESDYNATIQRSLRDVPVVAQNTEKLGTKIAEASRATAVGTAGMTEWHGTLVKSHEGVTKLGDGLTQFAPTVRSVSDTTAEYARRIADAETRAAGWSSGLELNGVKMLGLRDAVQVTAEKLAYLQSIEATLPDGAAQVAKANVQAKEALDRYNAALAEHIDQLEAKQAAVERSNALEQKGYDLSIQQVKAEGDLAAAKGDTATATRKEAEAAALQNQQAEAAIAKKTEEIAVYADLIAATKEKLAADGSLNAADQAQLATMAQTLTGMEQERQGMAQTAEATRLLTEAKQAKKEADEAAAKAAKEAADAEKESAAQLKAAGDGVNSTWSAANKVLAETGGNMEILTAAFIANQEAATRNSQGWIDWATKTAYAADSVAQAYRDQKDQLDGTVATLQRFVDEGDNVTAAQQAMIQSGGNLQNQYSLLDEQDLSKLRGALADANQKLVEMQQEAQDAQDAIATLNAEIAAEKGDTATAARLKLELEQKQKLADLDAKIRAAELQGNLALLAALNEQKQKLEELYQLKTKNLEADLKAQQQQTKSGATSGSNSTTTDASGGASRSATVNSGATTGNGLSNRSNAFSLTVNTTGGIIDPAFAENLARQLKPQLDALARRSL